MIKGWQLCVSVSVSVCFAGQRSEGNSARFGFVNCRCHLKTYQNGNRGNNHPTNLPIHGGFEAQHQLYVIDPVSMT